jgi:hypothetical protein
MARRASLATGTEQNRVKVKEPTVKVTFELVESVHDQLRFFAFDARKTKRDVLTDAVRNYLSKRAR